MITTEFFNPNISIQISGMSYYTITLAFETFRPALNKGIGFSSFYKNFAKWRIQNEILAETRHIAKLYSERDILMYINYLNGVEDNNAHE